MSRGETAFLGLLGAVGIAWILDALQLPYQDDFVPAAGFFPLWIAVALVGLVSVLLITQWRTAPPIASPARPRRPALVVLALAVSVSLLDRIGFAAAVAGLVLFLVGYVEQAPWRVTLASAIVIPGAITLVFRILLSIPLPRGPWGF
jgi:putative tricarboxylic transport membrane protein